MAAQLEANTLDKDKNTEAGSHLSPKETGERKIAAESDGEMSSLYACRKKLENHLGYQKRLKYGDFSGDASEINFRQHLLTDFMLRPKAERCPLFVFFPLKSSQSKDTAEYDGVYSLNITRKEIIARPLKSNEKSNSTSGYHEFILGVIPTNGNLNAVIVAYNQSSLVLHHIAGKPPSSSPPGTPFPPVPELLIGHTFRADPQKGLDALDVFFAYLQGKGFKPSRSPAALTADQQNRGKSYTFVFHGAQRDVDGGAWVYQLKGDPTEHYVGTDKIYTAPPPPVEHTLPVVDTRPPPPPLLMAFLMETLREHSSMAESTKPSTVTMTSADSTSASETSEPGSRSEPKSDAVVSMSTTDSSPGW